MTGETSRVPDGTLAAQLVEEPFRTELGVLHLVVVQVPGVRVGHIGVHGDGLDPGSVGLGESRVEGVRIVGVEYDRVDALSNEAADVGELAGRVGVAVDHREVGDLAGRLCLRLGGAHLLLAEAVADAAAVRIPDRVLLGARGRASPGTGRRPGRRTGGRRDRDDGQHCEGSSPHRWLDHSLSSLFGRVEIARRRSCHSSVEARLMGSMRHTSYVHADPTSVRRLRPALRTRTNGIGPRN